MKINRLMGIIIILLNKETITAKELADRFGVSQRTIYRDIDVLSSSGIPVYMTKGKGGGISLLKHYTLNKAILSDQERDNMVFALKTLGATNQLQIDNTLEKLNSIFGNINSVDWVDVDFTHWGSNRDIDTRFDAIKEAILKQRVLTFKYVNTKNIKSDRTIKPFKIIFKGQNWYLSGFCCEKKASRLFKITRMRDVKVTNIDFKRKEINTFFKITEAKWDFNVVKLKLRFNSNMLYRIIDNYRDDQIFEESDGSYIITAEFPYDEWVYSHILSYGDNVEVVEPDFVRKEVKRRIENMFKKYKI